MAKRKRVAAPTTEDLKDLEASFAAKPRQSLGPMAPIAQVAGQAAGEAQPVSAEARAAQARDTADAARLREAEAEGRLVLDLPVAEIVAEELTRDRAALDAEEMEELKRSISANGLRLPIEVFRLEPAEPGRTYGLLSGYRRLRAVQELEGQGASIRAVMRERSDVGRAYTAMVEENEIRSGLSQYEKGRIAALAAGQGAFASVAEAVDAMFFAGSKAKRSKIRSFAAIHEELGDLLLFPQALSERQGLKLAGALKAGQGGDLRQALVDAHPVEAAEEWAVLEAFIAAQVAPRDPSRGGRPKTARRLELSGRITLGNGVQMYRETDDAGHSIRLTGRNADVEFVETVMQTIEGLLRKTH
ncbi:MAG: ParB N-terminal domain-containing protein [Pseudomonadota bacterium]